MRTLIKKIFYKLELLTEYIRNILYFIFYVLLRVILSLSLVVGPALYSYPIKAEEPEETIEEIIPIVTEETIEPEVIDILEEPEESEPVSSEIDIPIEVQYKPVSFGDHLTKSGGVYYNKETSFRETWYSQRVLPGGGLRIPGRHVDERGIICDEEGYICVASQDLEKGTIVNTSLGLAKVYDYCGIPGTIDIYVDW